MVPTQQQEEEGGGQTNGETQFDRPEYAMTKDNIKRIAQEISTSRKKKGSEAQGKGKHKVNLPEESEDEEELLSIAGDILEDATLKKLSVET